MIARGYIRLSRDDLRKGDTVENHVGILLALAERNRIPLDRSSIFQEIESSEYIDTREGLTELLRLASCRQVTHVLVYDVARMTRGMEDEWARIKRALFRGNVTLLTARGISVFDNRLDTTLLDIEAVFARRYRWEYSVKRQDHNIEKARRGKRYCGSPPYGYRTLKPPTDIYGNPSPPTDEDVSAGHAQADESGVLRWRSHVAHPEEYPVVCEIFRRIYRQGARGIVRWLNEAGVTPPLQSRGYRQRKPTTEWQDQAVRHILQNPFYAGYIARRNEVAREQGQVPLPRDQWVWAREPGDWIHPVELEEWEYIQSLLPLRRVTSGPGAPFGLLSGLLKCERGRSMRRAADTYTCECRTNGFAHRGAVVQASRYEPWVKRIVEEAVAGFDPSTLAPPRDARGRGALMLEISHVERQIADKQRALDDLMRRSDFFLSLPDFGADRYQANVEALAEEGAKLRDRLAELRAEAERPEPQAITALLDAVRGRPGLTWDATEEGEEQDAWTAEHMRALIRLVIQRIVIRLTVVEGHYQQAPEVVMQPWFSFYTAPPLGGTHIRNKWTRVQENPLG